MSFEKLDLDLLALEQRIRESEEKEQAFREWQEKQQAQPQPEAQPEVTPEQTKPQVPTIAVTDGMSTREYRRVVGEALAKMVAKSHTEMNIDMDTLAALRRK